MLVLFVLSKLGVLTAVAGAVWAVLLALSDPVTAAIITAFGTIVAAVTSTTNTYLLNRVLTRQSHAVQEIRQVKQATGAGKRETDRAPATVPPRDDRKQA